MASSTSQTPKTSSPIINGKEPRPFLRIRPVGSDAPLTKDHSEGLRELDDRVGESVQLLVRALVNYTVSIQNRESFAAGRVGGTTVSILNRRRRSARAWVLAILGGKIDEETLHVLTHTWLPQLAGTGPDKELAVAAGTEFLEFLRGAITALVMSEPADNLLPEAKALYALETVLGVHMQALREVAQAAETGSESPQKSSQGTGRPQFR